MCKCTYGVSIQKQLFPYCVLVASIWMLLSYGFWNQTEKSLFSTYLAYNPDDFNSRTLQHNQIQSVMDVITIESKAYHELMGKIEKILRYVEKEEKAKIEYENRLVTNDELAEILGISKRTLQRMRSADRISYKMIYGRCYYALHDIEEAIRNKSLYCNPQNLKELRHNFELKSRRVKDGTIG